MVEAVQENLFKFAMADTQKRDSHERSVVCGSTAEGPGSASYSKWPRLQADTRGEVVRRCQRNRGVQVQVT